MDVARYADSDGFLFDNLGRFQHPYRDWVISAFERNIPYDKFVTWQLAGDKLPNPTQEQLLATSFARMGKRSNEGGIIDEEYRVEYGLERTELVGKAFLGLTVGCAKCHDHKYDVISQRDFYSIYAFFNNLDERGIGQSGGYGTPMGPTLAWPTPMQARQLADMRKVTAAKEAEYQAARDSARRDATSRIEPLLAASAEQRSAFLQQSMSADLQAYYPLDTEYKGSFASLLLGPDGIPLEVAKAAEHATPGSGTLPADSALHAEDPDLPHLAGMDVDQTIRARRQNAAQRRSPPKPFLPQYLSTDQLAWSPSAIPGNKPAALNNVKLVPGVKGQAALLDDSVGMADHAVGFFERTQPFTLDVWVKLRADKPYEEVNLLYNRFQFAGREGQGYELQLRDNHLRFALVHSQPYNQLAVIAKEKLPTDRWIHVTATYDGNSRAAGTKLYVDGAPVDTEVTHDRLTRSSLPAFGRGPFDTAYGFAWGKSFTKDEFKGGSIDEIKVYGRALTPVEVAFGHDPAAVLAMTPDVVRPQLVDITAARDSHVAEAWLALRQAREAEQAAESKVYQVMVMADAMTPRTTHVLSNGLYNEPRDEVQAQAPSRVFRWDDNLSRDRLGLTQWLFDKDNPLTARVYVNRLWQSHFGNGIVETIEDFGTQGSNPTHPELLDWLAVEFVRSGWDIRHMHKLMVMSSTYRQSSNSTPELLERDSRNLLLARGPRYRMPAEMIRDNALFASGLLVDRVGGDSVFPYQPEGVWDNIGVGAGPYPENVPDDQMHRRSMYTFVRRNAAYPALTVFDMPDRNVSAVFRRISNTPLQALVLLNDPQYVEAYRKLAERALKDAPTPDQQLVTVFPPGNPSAPSRRGTRCHAPLPPVRD